MAGQPSALSPGLGHAQSLLDLTRNQRASQADIRALLARTTQALDKIVSIRESLEEFVDFKQFERKPQRLSRPSRVSSSIAELGDHTARSTTASSYGSTETSSLSEGTLDRSTNSTIHSSSSFDDEDEHDVDRDREDEIKRHARVNMNERGRLELEEAEEGETFDDDQASSSFTSSISTVEEIAPLKEARLERLKSINISFHEGLPKEFFQSLCRFLNSALEVKTRHSRFNFYKEAFTGGDAVREMLLSGFAVDHQTATRYGNVLVRLGFIEHVSRTDDQLHNSKDNFYRFTKVLEYDDLSEAFASDTAIRRRASINANNYRESVLSNESNDVMEYDFSSATDEVHALVTEESLHVLAKVLHKVFERKNKLLFYKGYSGCFLGAEAINVIREMRITTSLIDAVLIGQALLDDGLIEPIATTVSTFQDKYIFYRLMTIPSS
ncbi:mercuric reductase [Plasmopara halstedii]|uniref:Mercuric reductase n=1 Tax=Plasmopara halstedii TaxID=4781 RepID=A0A0P1AFF1_PLAHL|nr:mercuric reductase [Plasmopara halstedii]CEG39128.1 mercuric reductase [Plasmopara halstedii]|eukprot:XP_024575497.1 mercuric reductase [Plasmopara halstedii]